MKHLIPPLFAVLVIVNAWGEEWFFAGGLSVANCNALASELQAELDDGERAQCKTVLQTPHSMFPSINRVAEARATFARTRRAEELHQGALEEQRQRNELIRRQLDAFKDLGFK